MKSFGNLLAPLDSLIERFGLDTVKTCEVGIQDHLVSANEVDRIRNSNIDCGKFGPWHQSASKLEVTICDLKITARSTVPDFLIGRNRQELLPCRKNAGLKIQRWNDKGPGIAGDFRTPDGVPGGI
jgi:hypothetical protein